MRTTSHFILAFVVSIFWAAFCGPAKAADFETFELKKSETIAIVIAGEIERGDEQKFKKLAIDIDKGVVILDSDGGATLTAIEIGKIIRLKGFDTMVASDSQCNSACGLIWLAGSKRILADDSKIGFHASYLEEDGEQRESGVGNAIVGRYLTLLNLTEEAIIFVTAARPNELNWLTTTNSGRYGIDLLPVKSEAKEAPPIVTTSPSAAPKDEVIQWKAVGSWGIAVDTTMGNGCFMIGEYVGGLAFRIGYDYRSGIKKNYIMIGRTEWKNIKKSQEYSILITFDDSKSVAFKAIGGDLSGIQLLMVDGFQNNTWDDIAKSKQISISYNNRVIETILIEQFLAAKKEVDVCQSSQSRPAFEDPFM